MNKVVNFARKKMHPTGAITNNKHIIGYGKRD